MASVLVIGSGLGGLLAAVRAADAGHHVVLVTKSVLPESNTRYAQGGIAAALFRDDSVDAHVLDTLRAGAGLCDPEAVRVLCTEGPARVRDLIRFGVDFDRDESGVARGLEAAHSRSRVVHAGGDATGAAVEAALVATVQRRTTIEVREHTMLVDLLVSESTAHESTAHADPAPGTRVVHGARVLGPDGVQHSLNADAVILATGGAGALYTHTTNPTVATGDGVAAAYRAGASVADLEFYQFHPTALAVPGTPLVSEAVRGEGAVLRGELGERFMLAEHPDAELAPRDVVARAIARQMERQHGAPVSLDATALGRDLLETRFPTITAACTAAGLDWAVAPIPVAPAAHYWMGGVETDVWGRTSLPGLFAVGEVARTGAHGANRLASNSLLEAAVFADRAVRALGRSAALEPVATVAPVGTPTHQLDAPVAATQDDPSALAQGHDRAALQNLMWEFAGVHRSGAGLAHAADTLVGWIAPAATSTSVADLEDRNLLDLARLLVSAALAREESRGAHYRSDFPLTRPELAQSRSQTRYPALVPAKEAIAC
ncbi:L-aspartate oxidase [Cryobacterium sp. PH29-G1]|uniref:L-aspartate oxidase n=1 Tax=Cryobacterium sp. PH29-G1 TaxID=3046211 RepID=UPI0024BB2349|nr:L-aspartate oxidase [Cryobacterium sp. PH29-G1]MDJ0349010.1 L-aspartate oxidase [Cryobacterium sp. PH29-G1]